jgi:chaperonin GroES
VVHCARWNNSISRVHPKIWKRETFAMAQAAKQMKLRPLHDRVFVKRVAEQSDKHGRIIIPDSAKEKPQEGQVLAVGTGRISDDGKTIPLAVKEGDRILFGKYSGSEVKLDGEEFLIMKEEDVLGILGA